MSDSAPSVCFGTTPAGEVLVPLVEALAELWQNQVASAPVTTPLHTASEGESQPLLERLAALERSVSSLTSAMAQARPDASGPPGASAKARSTMHPKRPASAKPAGAAQPDPGGGLYPGLDRGVVAAALAAGVETTALTEMSRMVSSSPLLRLRPEGAKASTHAKHPAPLDESEEEGHEELADTEHQHPPAAVPAESAGSAEAFAQAMVRCLDTYTGKASSARSMLDRALEAGGGGSLDGSLNGGRRSAAARRALREALVTAPQEISNLIETAMAEDMSASTPGAGAPQLSSTRGWLEHRSRDSSLSDYGPSHMGHRWSVGLHTSREGATGKGSSKHSHPHGRSGQHRPGQLVAGSGAISGNQPTNVFIRKARSRELGRGSCVQQVAGREVGRGCSGEVEGGSGIFRSSPKAQLQVAGSSQRQLRSCARSRQTSAATPSQAKSRCMNHDAGHRRTPGSEAPCLAVPALVNSLPRTLLKGAGRFSSFLRCSLQREAKRSPTPFTWPCPMPFPEAFLPGTPGLWKKMIVNLSVARLSFEHMGCPTTCPSSVRLGVPLNPKQWQLVRNIEHLVFGSFFPLTFEPEDYGRIGHKVEGQAKTLQALGRAAAAVCQGFSGYLPRSFTCEPVGGTEGPSPATDVGTLPGRPDVAAIPIVADRVKLPSSPAFDPVPFMDRTTREFYQFPLHHARTPDPLSESPPFVKILADSKQKLLLLRNLARSGRLLPLKSVPASRLEWGAGLFCVAKDGAKDRLVLDARPANELEDFPGHWVHTLASASCLSSITLHPARVPFVLWH